MSEQRFDLAASALRADAADAEALAEALVAKLVDSLPRQVTVRRTGGLFTRRKRIESLSVQLGDDTFTLTLGQRAEATRAKTVRGVVLRRDELPLDAWLTALGNAVAAEAERSEAARVALERLLA